MTFRRDLSDKGPMFGSSTEYVGTHPNLNAGMTPDEVIVLREAAFNSVTDPKSAPVPGRLAVGEETVTEFVLGVSAQIDAELRDILEAGTAQ